MAGLSGWRSLANQYAYSGEVDGRAFAGQSIQMGYARFFLTLYSAIVKANLTEDHLYLKLWGPFRIGHRPLKIPLSEIEGVVVKTLFNEKLCLRFRGRNRLRIYLRGYLKDVMMLLIIESSVPQ